MTQKPKYEHRRLDLVFFLNYAGPHILREGRNLKRARENPNIVWKG